MAPGTDAGGLQHTLPQTSFNEGDTNMSAIPPSPKPSPSTPGGSTPPGEPESSAKREPAWGAIVVIAGLVAIVAVFVVAVLQYNTAADVTTAVGAVSGVIAALVGAYFGIRGATLAQANAEAPAGTKSKTEV
jgi:hypothetical protein